jgi:hypothetical protein
MRTTLFAAALASMLATPIAVDAKGPVNECGLAPGDWCPSPPGDPCGRHKDVKSCKADRRCKGMPYRGESAVACVDDGKGFSSNCPTVGCISR